MNWLFDWFVPIAIGVFGIWGFLWGVYNSILLACYWWTRSNKAIPGTLPGIQGRPAAGREECTFLRFLDNEEGINNAPGGDADAPATAPAPVCSACGHCTLVTSSDQEVASSSPSAWNPNPNIQYPMVTVVLPAYNEIGCMENLLHYVTRLHWPTNRLQLQLLDDSTMPEAVELASKLILEYQEQGYDIEHCQRDNRVGYKAGNLLAHFSKIQGTFTALFDADFLPPADYLLRAIPHFYDKDGNHLKDVGLVQGTWDHYNQTDNLLTHAQGIAQNMHFLFKQNVRCRAFGFIPFDGTAGVWSTEAIAKAGNWNYDTVTEDLDLACRAKVQGYRFVFLEDLTVPSELPPTMMAYKRQQRRWTQGHVQVARKILGAIWRSPRSVFSLTQKMDISFILLWRLDWISGFCTAVLVPLLGFAEYQPYLNYLMIPPLFLGLVWSSIFLTVLYDTKLMHPTMSTWQCVRRVYMIPIILILVFGTTFWNFVSVLEGFILNDIPFATTPKMGRSNEIDEGQLQRMAEADDTEAQLEDETERGEDNNGMMTMTFEGWGEATTAPVVKKRRRPGILSKSFANWAHFVELTLALYFFVTPFFYGNILFGAPLMVLSSGFFWVALPGVKTSLLKWANAVTECLPCCITKSKEQAKLKRSSNLSDTQNDASLDGQGTNDSSAGKADSTCKLIEHLEEADEEEDAEDDNSHENGGNILSFDEHSIGSIYSA